MERMTWKGLVPDLIKFWVIVVAYFVLTIGAIAALFSL